MILIIAVRIRDKVMFVLRMLFAICIIILLAVHFCAYLKASTIVDRLFS